MELTLIMLGFISFQLIIIIGIGYKIHKDSIGVEKEETGWKPFKNNKIKDSVTYMTPERDEKIMEEELED